MRNIGRLAFAPCEATGKKYHNFTSNTCDDCHKTWMELWHEHDKKQKEWEKSHQWEPSPDGIGWRKAKPRVRYTLKRRVK